MSFLVIGNKLDALILSDYLYEHGWPVNIMSKSNFEYRGDSELASLKDLDKLGLDYKPHILTEINKMRIIDYFGKSYDRPTKTVLLNLSKLSNDLYFKLKKNCKIFTDTTYIDKNNENIFIQQGVHGTLLKAKHVFAVNDMNLANNLKTKKCIRASFELKQEKSILTLKFLDSGYLWYVNYSDKVGELCIVSDTPEKDLENFILDTGAKIIYRKGILLPYYKPERPLQNKGVFLSGDSAFINNNLNFYNFISKLEFMQLTCKFAHDLMTKKNISYPFFTRDYDRVLEKYFNRGEVFWTLSKEQRNKLIHKMSFEDFALDFNSAFENSSILSIPKLKLLFK